MAARGASDMRRIRRENRIPDSQKMFDSGISPFYNMGKSFGRGAAFKSILRRGIGEAGERGRCRRDRTGGFCLLGLP